MKEHSEPKSVSRRNLLIGSATAGIAAAMSGVVPRAAQAAGNDEQITIFSWETYHDDDWLAEYSKKTGVKVNVIRSGSVDEMFAKLRSGAVVADVIYLDVGSVSRLIDAKLIAPLEVSKITNASNIAPGIEWQKRCTQRGKVWAVPYNWGTQPLMFNTKVVTPRPTSWQTLWDKKYVGKVNLPDDAYITFPMVALAVGAKDPYHLTDAEFNKCIEALRDLRPQLRTIARGFDDATSLYASGDAELGYCQNISTVFDLQKQGKPFDYAFPREGTPLWIDCAILTPKGAGRKPVYDFINEGLTPTWQARFIKRSTNNGILTAAAASAAGVPQDVIAKTNIASQEQPGFWSKMSVLQTPESMDRRLEIWNAFKAGTL
ncbi:ABC transporter substrate-binding protein [Caballeronia megalochromosomata]|nr:ABC transporter substrate-binding protein [Caballeronia megalochromosomata]